MSDVTMADCYVIGGNLQPPRPMTPADLDSLIRERGVTDEMVERGARALYEAIDDPDGLWDDDVVIYEPDSADYYRRRAGEVLEAVLMTEESPDGR